MDKINIDGYCLRGIESSGEMDLLCIQRGRRYNNALIYAVKSYMGRKLHLRHLPSSALMSINPLSVARSGGDGEGFALVYAEAKKFFCRLSGLVKGIALLLQTT